MKATHALVPMTALALLVAAVPAGAKPTRPSTPPPTSAACTLHPSLTHPSGDRTTCTAVGAALSAVPVVGRTATLTVTVQAATAQRNLPVTIDLPRTLAFADGTTSQKAVNGAGPTVRATTTLSFTKAGTQTFTRIVKTVGAGFGEIDVAAGGGADAMFLTTGATTSHYGLDHAPGTATTRAGVPARVARPARVHAAAAATRRAAGQQPASEAGSGTACVTGSWNFVDQNGVSHGVDNMEVQAWRGSTLVTSGVTDWDGSYNLCWASNGQTQSGVHVVTNTRNATWAVVNFSNYSYSFVTATVNVADGATYDFGYLQPADSSVQRALHAFQEADDEYQWVYRYYSTSTNTCWSPFESICGNALLIHWAPDNSTQGTDWTPSGGVRLLAGSPDTLDEPVHEYGHNLMYHLYNEHFPPTPGGSHDLFTTATNQAMAWAEGWADWVATSVYNNMVWTYNGGGQANLNVTWNSGSSQAQGDQVEARIVQAMRSLTDGTKYPFDNDPGEGSGIDDNRNFFTVLNKHQPATFADFWAGRAAEHQDIGQTALSALYQGTIDYGFVNPLQSALGKILPQAVPDHRYSFATTRNYWSVVAVRPNTGSDADLVVYNDAAHSSSLAGSANGGTAIDLVGINSNKRATQTYYPQVHQYSGTGSYAIDAVEGGSILSTGGASVQLGAATPAYVWDSDQTAGQPVYYRAVPASGQDVQLGVFAADGTVLSGNSMTRSIDRGAGQPTTLAYNPTATGFQGLVLMGTNTTLGFVHVYADHSAPTGSIKINNGATQSASRYVTLSLSGTDADTGVEQMRLSDDAGQSTTLYYGTSFTWPLQGNNGPKKVYVQYMNKAGMWSSQYTATITLAIPHTENSVSPASGPAAGGNTVQIQGSGFTGATSVAFGSTNATSFTVASDSTISVKVPAHAAGPVKVIVTTPYAGPTPTASARTYTYQ